MVEAAAILRSYGRFCVLFCLLGAPATVCAEGLESINWDPLFHQQLAREHLKARNFTELKKEIRILKFLAPFSAETTALEFRFFESQGKWNRILDPRDPKAERSVESELIRAKALMHMGNLAESEKLVKALLASSGPEKHPLLAEVLETHGDLAVLAGQKNAEDIYRSALSESPQSASILTKISDVLAERGEESTAAEILYPLIVPQEIDSKVAFRYLAYLEKSGQSARAASTLQSWRANRPETRWLDLSYANLLDSIGQAEAAKGLRFRWKNVASKSEGEEAQESARAPKTIVVRAGDTLQSVSNRLYGTTKRWKEIRDINISYFRNGNEIFPGMELAVPQDIEVGGASHAPVRKLASNSFLMAPEENVPAEGAQTAQSPPPENTLAENAPNSAAIHSNAKTEKGYLWIGAEPAGSQNSIVGGGFQASAMPDIGVGKSIRAAYQFFPGWELSVGASDLKSNYGLILGQTPSSLTVSETKIHASSLFSLRSVSRESSFLRNIWLGFGWKQKQRNSLATRPNVVISAFRASGPLVAAEWRGGIYGSIDAQAGISAFFPNSYSEQNTDTGRFVSARGLEASLLFLFPLVGNFGLTAGISYETLQANFSGVGTRGASSATETIRAWRVPLGLGWKF